MLTEVVTRSYAVARLRTTNIRKLSRSSGIPRQVLYRLRNGGDTYASTMEKLSDFWRKEENQE